LGRSVIRGSCTVGGSRQFERRHETRVILAAGRPGAVVSGMVTGEARRP
jgi:hypothetical protein